MTLQNATQFPVTYARSYFFTGRYWDAPGGVPAYSQAAFAACNADYSVGTGATGGNAFSIQLDGEKTFDFALMCAVVCAEWAG